MRSHSRTRPITVTALKADRSVHRYCNARLELVTETGCVIWTDPGNAIYDSKGLLWVQDSLVRTLFVYGARLNLLEIHEPDRTPRQTYMNVIAPMEPPQLSHSEVVYIDHELDVLKAVAERRGARIVDNDEFELAIEAYGYDEATIRECWAAARLGQEIANVWQFGLPAGSALESFAALLQ